MFDCAEDVKRFITGGNARLTVRSKKTGKHYTYKISQGWDHDTNKRDYSTPYFVSVLCGPDNESDYMYIGFIPQAIEFKLVAGNKGKPGADSYKALSWVLKHLNKGEIHDQLEISHEGSCCRCGRTLTHPDSIASGIGPECSKHF